MNKIIKELVKKKTPANKEWDWAHAAASEIFNESFNWCPDMQLKINHLRNIILEHYRLHEHNT